MTPDMTPDRARPERQAIHEALMALPDMGIAQFFEYFLQQGATAGGFQPDSRAALNQFRAAGRTLTVESFTSLPDEAFGYVAMWLLSQGLGPALKHQPKPYREAWSKVAHAIDAYFVAHAAPPPSP